MINLKIKGKPLSKTRPRAFKSGRRISVYNDQSAEMRTISNKIRLQYDGKLLSGPIRLSVTFSFSRPKNHFRTGKFSHLLKECSPVSCMNSKDLDNLMKLYMDCLTGTVWEDDRQVIEFSAKKEWGEDFVYISIQELA